MFTGIVAARGEVRKVDDGSDRRVWVASALLGDCELGASVAVNGVCLTVSGMEADGCRFDVSTETMERTTLGDLEPGDAVNLERPLKMGDELGGHIVQGHVDGVGVVEAVRPEGEGFRTRIGIPVGLAPYIVEKGSVTVDGVSLTVTGVDEKGLEAALVPHTLEVTTLGGLKEGRRVNIEVDVLARFVERLLSGPNRGPESSNVSPPYVSREKE